MSEAGRKKKDSLPRPHFRLRVSENRDACALPDPSARKCAFLGVNPLKAPAELPPLDLQTYFGFPGTYRPPKPGSKLDLTHLLVVVPAMIAASTKEAATLKLADPRYVRPLHQKLVSRLRNATAHTYAAMDEADATFFFNTCDALMQACRVQWDIPSEDAHPAAAEAPSLDQLSKLLHGRTASTQTDAKVEQSVNV